MPHLIILRRRSLLLLHLCLLLLQLGLLLLQLGLHLLHLRQPGLQQLLLVRDVDVALGSALRGRLAAPLGASGRVGRLGPLPGLVELHVVGVGGGSVGRGVATRPVARLSSATVGEVVVVAATAAATATAAVLLLSFVLVERDDLNRLAFLPLRLGADARTLP